MLLIATQIIVLTLKLVGGQLSQYLEIFFFYQFCLKNAVENDIYFVLVLDPLQLHSKSTPKMFNIT
jgi:hypothetical protein